LAREEVKASPDSDLIQRFLKTAVVVSSDGTNEAAYITQARKPSA
jgi:type I restriction enzyme R subunit